MPVKPIPQGFHSVTAHLVVDDGNGAIDFYKQTFGAKEVARLALPDGKIAHAELKIGDSLIMVTDEFPDWGNHSPKSLGGTPVHMHLYVEDVDSLAERAVAAGAEVLIPIADQFYGDRAGRLRDPYGHVWIVATHKEDMTEEEVQRRFKDFMASTG